MFAKSGEERLIRSIPWLLPLDEDTSDTDFVAQWSGAQLSFNIHPHSMVAFDHICSSSSVERMLSSPTAFKRWMHLSSNFALRLEYIAAINLFLCDHSASTVSSELHILEGSCAMVALCDIHLTEPLNADGSEDASKKLEPEVCVFLTNLRGSSPVVQERRSHKVYAATRPAGTPRFVIERALPNLETRTDQPAHSTQCRISL